MLRGQPRQRISDLVTDALVSAIRDLVLQPGELVSETELSGRLQVSRTPVREAISRLVDLGLLTVVAQVGTRVARIDLAGVEQAVFIRSALETAAFREACTRDGGRDVVEMRRILASQRVSLDTQDAQLFFNTDEAFHQEVFRLAGQPEVWSVVRSSKLQLDRVRRLLIPEAIKTDFLLDEHTRLADLLEAGDVAAGVALIAEHARHVLREAPELRRRNPDYFTG